MKQIPDKLLDELLKDCETPEDILGQEGLWAELKKAVLERALEAELTAHLGYEKHDGAGRNNGNSRNGHGAKRVLTDSGELRVKVPRDRHGSFERQLVRQRQRRLAGFDDAVISLYARGMTQREIGARLEQLYGMSVSPELVSRVTEAVTDEALRWQQRPLEAVCPVLFFDALRVKVRDEAGTQESGLSGPGDPPGRHQGGAGAVDRADRGGPLLAEGHERAAVARGGGPAGRRGGWPARLPAGDSQRVPGSAGADLHRASDAARAEPVLLQGAAADGPRHAGHLPRRERGGRGRAPGRVRAPLGGALPFGGGQLAARLGTVRISVCEVAAS